MEYGISMEPIIHGLHEKERSYVGRKTTTPSIQRTRVERHLQTEAGQHDPHRDQQLNVHTHSHAGILMPCVPGRQVTQLSSSGSPRIWPEKGRASVSRGAGGAYVKSDRY